MSSIGGESASIIQEAGTSGEEGNYWGKGSKKRDFDLSISSRMLMLSFSFAKLWSFSIRLALPPSHNNGVKLVGLYLHAYKHSNFNDNELNLLKAHHHFSFAATILGSKQAPATPARICSYGKKRRS